MSISKILNSLEKSWKRDDILLKIKNGLDTDKIVNEFLAKNEIQIRELNNLLRPEDIDLLTQVEQLSTCESKLINEKKISSFKRVTTNRISMLMINWSNKFLVIALLTISAIALSKQAWA